MEGGLGGRDSLWLSIISLGLASLNNASGMWYRCTPSVSRLPATTGLDCTVLCRAAQRSTAQRNPAQHSTARNSTEQHDKSLLRTLSVFAPQRNQSMPPAQKTNTHEHTHVYAPTPGSDNTVPSCGQKTRDQGRKQHINQC